MAALLPEIQNIIYYYRPYCILRNICKQRLLNFDRLCDFLQKNCGAIFGSCALACFVESSHFSDIDICIINKTNRPVIEYYREFFEIFEIEDEYITVQKTPLINNEHGDGFYYYYKFLYPVLSGETIQCNTMYIDMSIISSSTFDSPSQLITDKVDIDGSAITFDGKDWHHPFPDMIQFMSERKCRLIDPFRRASFFDKIYNPDNELPEPKDFDNKFVTTIIKLAKDLNDLPSDHKRIYQCIIPDSVRKIVAEAKESYFSGDRCGKFSFGEWLKFSLFQVWTVEQAIEAFYKILR